jgi:hypothetical protein
MGIVYRSLRIAATNSASPLSSNEDVIILLLEGGKEKGKTVIRDRRTQAKSRHGGLDQRPTTTSGAVNRHFAAAMSQGTRMYQFLVSFMIFLSGGMWLLLLINGAGQTARYIPPNASSSSNMPIHDPRRLLHRDKYEASSRFRKHTIASYFDPTALSNTKDLEVVASRTILVQAPQRSRWRQLRLNYHDDESYSVENDINYADPDDGIAFDFLPDEEDRPCYPIADWQKTNHKACNNVHEMHLANTDETSSLHIISCGGNRCTFLVPGNEHQPSVVMKMLYVHDEFPPHMYRRAGKDSAALERLSGSPYVLDVYATCSLSKVVEYAKGGNIHDLLKRTRAQEKIRGGDGVEESNEPEEKMPDLLGEEQKRESDANETSQHFDVPSDENRYLTPVEYERHQLTTPLTKLKIAYQMATAVADMHAIEQHPDGLPAMVHNDLCCHQFVLIDGVYKLGDFDSTTLVTVREADSKAGSSPNETYSNLEVSQLRGGGQRYDTASAGEQARRRSTTPKEETCQITPVHEFGHMMLLAPEQLPYYDDSAIVERIYRDKLDVFQIGNICYTLLTNIFIWEGYRGIPALVATFHVSLIELRSSHMNACCCLLSSCFADLKRWVTYFNFLFLDRGCAHHFQKISCQIHRRGMQWISSTKTLRYHRKM